MLIHSRHDPRHYDRRLYKGGSSATQAMMQQEAMRQQNVQAAVDAINGKFGVAPSSAQTAPTRAQFTTQATQERWVPAGDSESGNPGGYTLPSTNEYFDQAGYDKAMADFNDANAAVSGAKTARDAMYADVADAVKQTAMRDLDRQYSEASNKNLFGLARSGLLGSSVDAESGGKLQELYSEGGLKAAQSGQSAANELRTTDEKTRQNLISLAQSGLDTGTAASMAANQLAATGDLAKSQAADSTVGDLFGNLSQAYLTNAYLNARYGSSGGGSSAPTGYGATAINSRYAGTVR